MKIWGLFPYPQGQTFIFSECELSASSWKVWSQCFIYMLDRGWLHNRGGFDGGGLIFNKWSVSHFVHHQKDGLTNKFHYSVAFFFYGSRTTQKCDENINGTHSSIHSKRPRSLKTCGVRVTLSGWKVTSLLEMNPGKASFCIHTLIPIESR